MSKQKTDDDFFRAAASRKSASLTSSSSSSSEPPSVLEEPSAVPALPSSDFLKYCDKMKQRDIKNIKEHKKIKLALDECKKKKYKYGSENISLIELLKIIKDENKQNHVNDLLLLFPETGIKGVGVSRSHVFEALWIIIFMLRLDDLFPSGGTRIFYDSLENRNAKIIFNRTSNDGIFDFFNDANANESNKSGIVDIYFEDIKENKKTVDASPKPGYACEKKCETTSTHVDTMTYFYSSKFFKDDAKKGISKLDIQDIFTQANGKLQKYEKSYKIGVLVKDIEVIFDKANRSKKALASLFSRDISYGIGTLNIFYKRLLKYLEKCDFESQNPFQESSTVPESIMPRFHQNLFIDFTNNRIETGNNKFIWGAVPRSGKSFMIGGLIEKRQPKLALIILGAVSETHDQFRDEVFKKYKGSFGDYEIVDIKDKKGDFSDIDATKKNILIVSQQKLWRNSKTYPSLIKLLDGAKNEKIIFFDEIHQGSGSDAEAQQKLLASYVVKPGKVLEFPFIMVTATFIKPMLKYETVGEQKAIVLQWTYEMMQNMKTISDEKTQELMIEDIESDRDPIISKEKSDIFKKLLKDYQDDGFTLKQLEEQYEKEPVLTIIAPFLTVKDSHMPDWTKTDTDMRDIFDIKKSEYGQTQKIQELLGYIKKDVYGIGNPSAVLAENNFNVLTRQHSQIWFLPTKLNSSGVEDTGQVEPMMRYLIRELMRNKFFRENFCFVIMHSKNISKLSKEYKDIFAEDSGIDMPHKMTLKQSMDQSGVFVITDKNNMIELDGDEYPVAEGKYRNIGAVASAIVSAIQAQTDITLSGNISNPTKITFSNSTEADIELTGTLMTDFFSGDLTVPAGGVVDAFVDANDKICFSTTCLPPNKSDKECLRKEECFAYAKQKSLIILTAGKLRLGISLPCADIALHMDPITSVDTIYQSMFRVLTPYPGKKQGFFVDLLKNRMIKFLYEYENQISHNKKNKLPEKKLFRLRNLIFALDLNGIVLKQDDNKAYVDEYTKLIETLGLEDVNTFQQKSDEFKMNKETSRTLVDSVFDDVKITELYKIFELSKHKGVKNKLEHGFVNRKGDGLEDAPAKPTGKPKATDKKELSIKEKREEITIFFMNLLSLFILFEDENFENCEEDYIENALKKISDIEPIDEESYIKLCEDDEAKNATLKCYLYMAVNEKYPHTLPPQARFAHSAPQARFAHSAPQKYLLRLEDDIMPRLLEMFNSQLDTFREMIKMITKDNFVELVNIYCNIKRSFLMIKKHHAENMSVKPCSLEFIKNEKVLKIIRERLTVRSSEAEQHGEVFTPPELVCEMLATLPASVWSNKDLTWLDPANGIGNFPIIIYYKLMEGLKQEIDDDDERSEHIIEKMLFMVELNPVNVKLCKKLFDLIHPGCKPNIVRANFLTEEFPDNFDIIVGNPPYNEGGIRAKSTDKVKREQSKSSTIWPIFVEKSLSLLKNTASYLLFIHPASWISLKSGNSELILSRQLLKIRYYNVVKSHKLFGNSSGEIPLTYYLLKNEPSKQSTLIYDNSHSEFVTFNIYENNFIPTESVEMMKKINEYTKKVGSLKPKYKAGRNSTKPQPSYTEQHPFPLINIAYNNINISYTSSNNLDTLEKKLILPNGSMGYPIIDNIGIMYPSSSDNHIIFSNDNLHQLKQLQNYLFCDLIFYIIVITKTRQKFLDNKVFDIIPDITKLTDEINITDELLIKLFGLSKKDLIGYENYKITGEGKLSHDVKRQFKAFDMGDYGITKKNVEFVRKMVESPKPPVKSSRRKLTFKKLSKSSVKSSTPTPPVKKSSPPTKKPRERCPNGSRKNKKTGKCERVSSIKGKGKGGKKIRSTRRKNKTGDFEDMSWVKGGKKNRSTRRKNKRI